MKIYIDGSGFNGEESKYVIAFEDGRLIKKQIKENKTSNEMEYEALLRALEEAKEKDEIYTDSQLLERQICGKYKVKAENLFPLFMKARKLIEGKKVTLKWVPRDKNYAGNILELKKKK